MNKPALENIVHISDISLDSDTEISWAMSLEEEKLWPQNYRVTGLVANYVEPEKRAKLARGLCYAMGMPNVLVGAGIASTARQPYDYEFTSTYPQPEGPLLDGQEVLGRAFESSADHSVTMYLHSAMTDAALFFQNNRSLVDRKLNRIFFQGGVKTAAGQAVLKHGRLQPDDSFNYHCDQAAAEEVVAQAQSMTDTTFVSRWAVYACGVSVPQDIKILEPRCSVAATAAQRMAESADGYWRAAHVPVNDPKRDLPPSRDRAYLVDTLLGGIEPAQSGDESIAHLVTEVAPFDVIMKLLSQDDNVATFCEPFMNDYASKRSQVIGFDKNTTNIRESTKGLLTNRLSSVLLDYVFDEPVWHAWDTIHQISYSSTGPATAALAP